MVVRSKHTSLAPFIRDKLFISIYKSLGHRTSAIKDASALTETCLARMLESSDNATIAASELRNIVGQVLSRFDQAASVHYQAFHPER